MFCCLAKNCKKKQKFESEHVKLLILSNHLVLTINILSELTISQINTQYVDQSLLSNVQHHVLVDDRPVAEDNPISNSQPGLNPDCVLWPFLQFN